MKRITLSHVAVAVAAVALFAASGVPAQAVSLVTGAQVKDNSLTGRDIRSNSITGTDVRDIRSGDIRDGSLTAADFRRGALAGGAKGDKGDKGEKGDKGDAGDPGPSRWLLVNAAGQIEAQSGGFRIANAYPAGAANGNVYIESGDRDLSNNGLVATLALENQVDQNGDGISNGTAPGPDANPEFSGEISTTRCAISGVVACAPMDIGVTPNVPTNAQNYFVVSPRNSDGTRTADGGRKRFYVVVSGPRD
ncbi:MAG TPA: hypothetical protein VKB54_03350 [Solirubrobacteraceae bacterium]|nr:hypothetical protein [Solirubrobacteraceae bacterium]